MSTADAPIEPFCVPVIAKNGPSAVKLSGLSKSTLWPLVIDGSIPSVMVGRRRLVIVEGLKAFMMRHQHKAA